MSTSPSLRVYYSPEMVAVFPIDSPSPRKPALVVADWAAQRLGIEVVPPTPVDRDDYFLAHDRAFVEAVFAGRRDNGFFNRDERVLASLPHTTGAMVAAALHAIAGQTFCCAPVSGFHHAMHAEIGVYCTFNGLIVAAQRVRAAGLARRVGILDYDMHYGDGTDDIIRRMQLDFISHYTAGREFKKPEQAQTFLRAVPDHVRAMRECQIILYQAGADPHVRDPLGGWLTTEQLRERDHLVFSTARELGIPVAWNLAGGYQEEADGNIPRLLEIHRNTAIECLRHL